MELCYIFSLFFLAILLPFTQIYLYVVYPESLFCLMIVVHHIL